MSTDLFNKRSNFYHDLGYKVVWVFDLTDEYENNKLVYTENEREIEFNWSHPRNTFNRYDIENGQIELFLQIKDAQEEKALVKVERASAQGFSRFYSSKWFSRQDFLQYFACTNGICPAPFREDTKVNDDYSSFVNKYNVSLDNQQERAAETIEGATLVLAVPGSGKTTTLIARIGYMVNCRGIDGNKILALTYTKNAAMDMKNRYTQKYGKNDSVQFRTINSIADEIMRADGQQRTLIDNRGRAKIVKGIYREYFHDEWPTEGDVKNAETSIAYIKNMMLGKEDAAKMLIWNLNAWDIYSRYTDVMKEQNVIDYDDQLILAYAALSANVSLLKRYHDKYDFICVDEAQDTSKIQYEIIKLLASKSHNIFMVGDEDQSIYRFRAAYPEGLLNFKKEYSNPFILQLETNYRSTEEIVDLAAEFIAKNENRYPKKMRAVSGRGIKPDVVLVKDRMTQYKKILSIAKQEDNQIAFLYRDNACALPIADLFLKNGIPFRIKKVEEILFFNEHIVNDIKAFLRLAQNDTDSDAFKQIYYKCGLYIEKRFLKGICGKVYYEKKTFSEALHEWYKYKPETACRYDMLIGKARTMKPAQAIMHFYNNGYQKYLSDNGMGCGHVEILSALAHDDDTVDGLFKHLETLERQLKNIEEGDANIVLSTVHSSKGLEYEEVYILDVFDGMFPVSLESNQENENAFEDYQEERRLFYVAMTRAKKKLHFLKIENKPSSFLDELFPDTDMTLGEIICNHKDREIIVCNTLTNKAYLLNFVDGSRFNAFSLDIETGELSDTIRNAEVHNARNRRIWKLFET